LINFRYKGLMKLLWLVEDIVRGNPDFEPAISGVIYVAVWLKAYRGSDHG